MQDVLRMVFGNTKWALDFLHYILNGLFDLADDLENTFDNPEVFAQSGKQIRSVLFCGQRSKLIQIL